MVHALYQSPGSLTRSAVALSVTQQPAPLVPSSRHPISRNSRARCINTLNLK